MADRAKFLDFMDMIDGGGRGQMGGEFKGGGIFSEIANMIATPYGSEDPERRRRLQERRRARGLLDMDAIGTKEEQAAAAARAAATPSVVKKAPPAPMMSGGPATRGGQRGPRVAPAGPPMPATAMSPVMPNQPMSTYDTVMPQANPMAGLGVGPTTRGGRRGGAVAAPDMPLPRVGNQLVPLRTRGAEFYKQPNIAPDYVGDYTRRQDYSTRAPYPSAMSPTAPVMPQGVMSFRDFVDAERAAMSGADRYVDPANYRRGYARYLSSMGINPAMMGM